MMQMTTSISLRLPTPLAQKLKALSTEQSLARGRCVSISELVRRAIERELFAVQGQAEPETTGVANV